jgi:hypothetical protein
VPGGIGTLTEGGASFVVLPLMFQDDNLGHMLLELDLRHAFAYGAIAEAMGVGLYYSLARTSPREGPASATHAPS